MPSSAAAGESAIKYFRVFEMGSYYFEVAANLKTLMYLEATQHSRTLSLSTPR